VSWVGFIGSFSPILIGCNFFCRSGITLQVLDKLNNVTYTPKTLGDGSNNQKTANGTTTTSSGNESFGDAALNTAAALAFVAIVITILC